MLKNHFNRRHFLKGSGAFIALPTLVSIDFKAFAAPKVTPTPKRIVFLGFGYGVTNETWFPDLEKNGTDYDLPQGLAPLARHKADFTVVQRCTNQYNNEGHWGSTFWLTGANRYAVPGQSFSNSISADQVAAQQLGQDTRFASIQLSSKKSKNDGHGPGLSMAWDHRGKPVAGLNSPLQLFHKLFSADDLPLEQRRAALKQKRSVLDANLADAKRVQHGLTKTDTDKLNEYFQSIRDIETRLSKDEQWLTVPKAKAPVDEPKQDLAGREEIEVMYNLIVAALQTDCTRVLTYRQPVETLLQSLDLKVAAHDMSHYSPGIRMAASQERDKAQSELLAGLIDKLKATKEPDGSSLFDHTILAYGSNIRTIHYLNDCPTIIAGGVSALKFGQNLVLPKDTPLCNVWLTMLNGIGVKVKRHGDSTGIVKELQA